MVTTEPAAQTTPKQNGEIQTTPQQALVRVVEDDSQFANLLDAGKFGHLQRVATLFANSALVPQHFQGNVPNCFIAMQMAMRMGVDPFMFMQNTYIVYGRPGMEAKLAIALINSSGLFVDSLDYEIVGDDPKKPDYKVRAFATRKSSGKTIYGPWVDWPTVKAEEWHSKKGSKWMTIPGLMFQYRAATFFGRLNCPERLMGMQTVDELRDTGDLPNDRTVISGERATSKAAALAAKVTSKPISENQVFEPTPEAMADAAQETISATQSPDTANPAEVPSKPATDAGVAGEPAKEKILVPQPKQGYALDHTKWVDAMMEAAMTLNVSESAIQAWMVARFGAEIFTKKSAQGAVKPGERVKAFIDFVQENGGIAT